MAGLSKFPSDSTSGDNQCRTKWRDNDQARCERSKDAKREEDQNRQGRVLFIKEKESAEAKRITRVKSRKTGKLCYRKGGEKEAKKKRNALIAKASGTGVERESSESSPIPLADVKGRGGKRTPKQEEDWVQTNAKASIRKAIHTRPKISGANFARCVTRINSNTLEENSRIALNRKGGQCCFLRDEKKSAWQE